MDSVDSGGVQGQRENGSSQNGRQSQSYLIFDHGCLSFGLIVTGCKWQLANTSLHHLMTGRLTYDQLHLGLQVHTQTGVQSAVDVKEWHGDEVTSPTPSPWNCTNHHLIPTRFVTISIVMLTKIVDANNLHILLLLVTNVLQINNTPRYQWT